MPIVDPVIANNRNTHVFQQCRSASNRIRDRLQLEYAPTAIKLSYVLKSTKNKIATILAANRQRAQVRKTTSANTTLLTTSLISTRALPTMATVPVSSLLSPKMNKPLSGTTNALPKIDYTISVTSLPEKIVPIP